MREQIIEPDKRISLVIKNILVFEEPENKTETILPFFADGYPGIILQQTQNRMRVHPQDKIMPTLFIYGQTIKPVELIMYGCFRLVVFQLYPFVLKSFFGLKAAALNDSCYDVSEAKDGPALLQRLNTGDIKKNIEIITDYLFTLFEEKQSGLDFIVRKALQIILDNKGQLSVKDLHDKLHITERTLERRFLKEVGILPKQFSQIAQFQQSFEQLAAKEYSRLTDIVYNNGYADQSHFIRVFKAYTGGTPKQFTA